MPKTQHTPGPWRLSGDGLYVSSKGHGYVPIRTPFREDAFEGDARSDHPEEEVAANTHLIAAAPELLEAAELCEAAWAGNGDMAIAIDAALLAIAKARGES